VITFANNGRVELQSAIDETVGATGTTYGVLINGMGTVVFDKTNTYSGTVSSTIPLISGGSLTGSPGTYLQQGELLLNSTGLTASAVGSALRSAATNPFGDGLPWIQLGSGATVSGISVGNRNNIALLTGSGSIGTAANPIDIALERGATLVSTVAYYGYAQAAPGTNGGRTVSSFTDAHFPIMGTLGATEKDIVAYSSPGNGTGAGLANVQVGSTAYNATPQTIGPGAFYDDMSVAAGKTVTLGTPGTDPTAMPDLEFSAAPNYPTSNLITSNTPIQPNTSDVLFLVHGLPVGTTSSPSGALTASQISGHFAYFYVDQNGDTQTMELTDGLTFYSLTDYNNYTLSSDVWTISYDANFNTGQFYAPGVGHDIAIEAGVVQLSSVPEASTLSMLFGAALMGLGYGGFRRLRRRKEDAVEEVKDSVEEAAK
jgi:hypothetical protein